MGGRCRGVVLALALAGCAPSPAAPAVQPPATLGQRVDAGGIGFTANGISRADQLAQGIRAAAGRTFLLVDVTLDNAARDGVPYSPADVRLRDGQGFEYQWKTAAQPGALGAGHLLRGERVRGTVAFEVPPEAAGFVAVYEPVAFAFDPRPPRARVRVE